MIIEIIYPIVKNVLLQNRIYCHDCNRSHIDNIMKKHCCSCNNLDLVCCISNLSLKSDVGVQTDFSDKPTNVYENIDPNTLIDYFGNYYCGCYNVDQSIAEAEDLLGELGRVKAITCEEYNNFPDKYFVK